MSFARDLAERVFWTFIQGFLAPLTVTMIVGGDITALRAALYGGAAAVLSLLKGVAASKVGTPGTASTADRPAVDELGNLETAP